MSLIYKQLKSCLEEWQSIQIATHHLTALQGRIIEAQRGLAYLEKVVDDEYRDVEKLEKLGIPGLFRTILGNKQQQLEIERQEYLQAVLKHRDAQKEVELLSFEEKILIEKINKKDKVQIRLYDLLQQREEELQTMDSMFADKLRELNTQLDEEIKFQQEIYEAKTAGEKTRTSLIRLINTLKRIAEAGTWGAGMTPAQARMFRDKFKIIQQCIWTIRPLISEFQDELKDVYAYRQHKLIRAFDEFGHAFSPLQFYDNLVSDWIVRKRIYNSIYQVESVYDQIERTLQALNKEAKEVKIAIMDIESMKQEIVKESLA